MMKDHGAPETAGAPKHVRPFSLRDAWLRVREARRELGSAEAAFEEIRARSSAGRALARDAEAAQSDFRVPTMQELDWPEPLSDEEAERKFLSSALRGAPGLEDDTIALRRRMETDGTAQPDIDLAVLALARDRVFGEDRPGMPGVAQPLEHREWVGEEYALGIGGQRVAVMGFSHWGEPDEDCASFTEDVIAAVCTGSSHAFFDHVQRYFGFDGRAAFWSKVAFFNYLPDLVGTGENRYAWGTQDQHELQRRL